MPPTAKARAKLTTRRGRGCALPPHLDVRDRVGQGARVVEDVDPPDALGAPNAEEARHWLGPGGTGKLVLRDRLARRVVHADVPASPQEEPGKLETDARVRGVAAERQVNACLDSLEKQVAADLVARCLEEAHANDVERKHASRGIQVRRVRPRGDVVPDGEVSLRQAVGKTNAEERVRVLVQWSLQELLASDGNVRLLECLDAVEELALPLVERFELGSVVEDGAGLGKGGGCGQGECCEAK